RELLERCAAAVVSRGRDDLAARLEGIRRRLLDPEFQVLVVGEFKQGKSSLINNLVGADVCPVDDDLATAVVTVVRHAAKPTAIVRYQADDGSLVVDDVSLADLARLVVEGSHRDGAGRVVAVE